MNESTSLLKEVFSYLNQITWKKALLHLFVISSCVFLWKIYTLNEIPFEVGIPYVTGRKDQINEKDIQNLITVIEKRTTRLLEEEDLLVILLFYFHDRDPYLSGFQYLKRSSLIAIEKKGVFYKNNQFLSISQDLPVLTMREEVLTAQEGQCVYVEAKDSQYRVLLLKNGFVSTLMVPIRDSANQLIGYFTVGFYKTPEEAKINRVCDELSSVIDEMQNTPEYIYLFDLAIRTK